MKKVLLAGSQDYFIDLAKLLKENRHWEPTIWLSYSQKYQNISQLFPTVEILDYISSVKGNDIGFQNPNKFKCICPNLLKKFSEYEAIALMMMERNDSNSNSFSHRDRVEFYHHLLAYWISKLVQKKINIVIFEEEPHQASDYVLYIVCKHLEIKTILFVRTINKMGILPMNSFEDGCLLLKENYNKNLKKLKKEDSYHFSPIVEDYFTLLSQKYEKVLENHLWDQFEELSGKSGPKTIFSKSNVILSKLKKLGRADYLKKRLIMFLHYTDSDQKEKNKSIFNSNQSYTKTLIFKHLNNRKKQKLKKYYEGIARNTVNDKNKYILCALQYQPEKSTSPLGGVFVNQYLMIDLLSKSLPEGWKLLVKEHPSQFVSQYSRYGVQLRSERYYQKINALDNVNLVSIHEDIFCLIDNAEAVASVGGTICWEAVARGKPALNFAHSWFSGCEGVIAVKSESSLKKAIHKIKNGLAVEQVFVKMFAETIVELGLVNAAIGGVQQLAHHNLTSFQNALLHEKAINVLYPKN